jgi:CheY-like chemotaxis protein
LTIEIETDLNLLIVDDNAAVRRLIADVVMPLGCEIRECADGAEALAAYHSQRPDLVLMDIRMDGMDGIEATRRIIAADPTAKIVIVTDYDDEEFRQTAIQEGACGYALKDNLLDLVRLMEEIAQND